MPFQQNLNAFIGAAVLGVIGAASIFLLEHYKQQKMRVAMAKDLARLEKEMSKIKFELHQLQNQRQKERHNSSGRSKRLNSNSNSRLSTADDYLSASELDSSDLEFYDLSGDESRVNDDIATLDSILEELDRELDFGNVDDLEETLQKIEDFCLEHPNNPELLYRIGKACHKIADKSDDREFICATLSKGIEACTTALSLAPNHAEVHKWYAVLLGSRSELVPIKEKINDGHLFKKHVDIAISINPNDAFLHYMLGRYVFEIAGLKWYERKVAQAFFGELPNATYEEACDHFLKTEQLATFEWMDNRLMISKCNIALGNYKEAVTWLEKAKNSRSTSLDGKAVMEINELLEKYSEYR